MTNRKRKNNSVLAIKIVGSLLFMVTILFVSLGAFSQTLFTDGPRIEVTPQEYDFGVVMSGEVVACQFIIENTGTTDLFIEKVKTSCGCTTAEDIPQQIVPGEKALLPVTFKSEGREGKQDKAVTIFSNDPAYPEVMVFITGVVLEGQQTITH